ARASSAVVGAATVEAVEDAYTPPPLGTHSGVTVRRCSSCFILSNVLSAWLRTCSGVTVAPEDLGCPLAQPLSHNSINPTTIGITRLSRFVFPHVSFAIMPPLPDMSSPQKLT